MFMWFLQFIAAYFVLFLIHDYVLVKIDSHVKQKALEAAKETDKQKAILVEQELEEERSREDQELMHQIEQAVKEHEEATYISVPFNKKRHKR